MNENTMNESVSQVEQIMRSTIENLKSVIDVNNIVGKPIRLENDDIVVPISKVSFGFVGGSSEFSTAKQNDTQNSVGGSGAGVSITPLGFLVCGNKKSFIKVDDDLENDKWAKLIKSALDIIRD